MPPDNIHKDYQNILEDTNSYDVKFKVGNEYIGCHKAILAAQSRELQIICSQTSVPKTKEHPEYIVLPGIRMKDRKEGPVISPQAFRR